MASEVGERTTPAMPVGDVAVPVRPDQQVEAGLGAVGLAELAELVGALVVEGVDPEAVAEVGHLDDHGLGVEIEEAKAVDDVLVRTGDEPLGRIDVVVQHADLALRRHRQNAAEQARLGAWVMPVAAVQHVHHRPAPDVGVRRRRT